MTCGAMMKRETTGLEEFFGFDCKGFRMGAQPATNPRPMLHGKPTERQSLEETV